MLQNLKLPDIQRNASFNSDYSVYHMTKREYVLYGLEGSAIVALFGYFFYRSVIITLVFLPAVFPYILYKRKQLAKQRQWNLTLQFKELLQSVNGSIQAGYSIENAFMNSVFDMISLFGKDSDIVNELLIISRGLNNGVPLIALLNTFSKRSANEDIRNFVNVLSIGNQTGGKIPDILNSYISVIDDKVALLMDINTITSSQRFEQKIMNSIPFFIIFYVDLTSRGFFNVLYHNAFGIIVMSICLMLYLLSIYLSQSIINIRI